MYCMIPHYVQPLPLIDQCIPLQTPVTYHTPYIGRTVPRPSLTVPRYSPSRHIQAKQPVIQETGKILPPPKNITHFDK